ncbi:S-adenosyl-L-methionine-dependent methyltransferase [Hyaloraphidium curvatum]|nr:S-adenosyl-L-methionine-dependent methyltransferase [Hyaloraphidium curvatum]
MKQLFFAALKTCRFLSSRRLMSPRFIFQCIIPMTMLLGPHCSQLGIVLDVGANIGVFSLFAASRGAPRVIAFEPNPRNAAKLRQSISANAGFKNIITVLEAGVSNVTGTAEFSAPVGNSGMGRISHDKIQPNKRHAKGFVSKVRMVSIDSSVPKNAEVSFMKIDVEGNELFALRSATALIQSQRVHVMVMEITQGGGFETVGIIELFEFLYQHGYSAAVVKSTGDPFDGKLQTLQDLKESLQSFGQARNVFFVSSTLMKQQSSNA